MSTFLCRIKQRHSLIFAKPIFLKDGFKNEDVINKGITSKQDKAFDELFLDSKKEKGKRIDRWSFYDFDINAVPEESIPYFLIDRKMPLYYMILEIVKEKGHKFKNVNSLKRHIYLSLLDVGISHEILKTSIAYFFKLRNRSKHDRTSRFMNKAFSNIDIWNYAVTFTYDSSLMNGEEFVNKLKTYLSNNASKKGWVYMGSFEKSPKGRDHFHCLMSIPDKDIDALNLQKETYYNKQTGKVDEANISVVLKEKFGRVDFQEIDPYSDEFIYVLEYICKYISKQENKIIYSKGIKDEYIGEISDFEENCLGFLYPRSSFYMMNSKVNEKIKKL